MCSKENTFFFTTHFQKRKLVLFWRLSISKEINISDVEKTILYKVS